MKKFLISFLAFSGLVVLPSLVYGQSVGDEIPSNTITTQIGQTTTPTTTCNPNASADTLKQFIKDTYGVDLQNIYDGSEMEQNQNPKVYFEQKHYLWACQKLQELSQKTKFIDLTHGVVVYPRNNQQFYSRQNSCFNRLNPRQAVGKPPAVYMYPHQQQSRFLLTLLHELGHIIWNCNSIDEVENKFRTIWAGKGDGLTSYSRNVTCTGAADTEWTYITEDFAETVAYYLIPDEVERDITNCPTSKTKPFDNPSSASHKEMIRQILGEYL